MPAETQPIADSQRKFFTFRRLLLAGLILLPVSLIGIRLFELSSIPNVGEPFDVEAFCAYRLPDEKNAFTHYRAVFALFVGEQKVLESHPSVNPQDFLDSTTEGLEDWSRAIPAVREWVALNRKAVDEWRRGADCEESLLVPPDQAASEAAAAAIGITTQLTRCSQLEGLEAIRLLSEGHPAAPWTCYRNLLRASRHLAMHAPLMGPLIGTGILSVGVDGAVIWSSKKSVGA
jgi:hypothetical protein